MRSEPTRYSHQRSWPASPISFRNFGQGWSCAASARPGSASFKYLRLRADLDRRSIAIEGQLQDIAAEIGITREALYRTLAPLEAEGSIAREGSAIAHKKPEVP